MGWTVRGWNSGEGKFLSPVQTDPGAHPHFYFMGTGSSPGLQRPGRGVDYPPSFRVDVKGKTKTVLLFSLRGFVACSMVNINLYDGFLGYAIVKYVRVGTHL
jgi:hypothetical protein